MFCIISGALDQIRCSASKPMFSVKKKSSLSNPMFHITARPVFETFFQSIFFPD